MIGRPPGGRVTWGAAAVVVAAAAIALIARDGSEREPDPRADRDRRAKLVRHVNRVGGYSFRHPRAWTVERDGTVSTLTSPSRDTLVTFGRAPAGDLLSASTRLVRSIRADYRDDELVGSDVDSIAGSRALLVSGVGTNRRGVRIRFLAITLRHRHRNLAIVVYTSARSDPERVLPPVQQVVDSFRPRAPAAAGRAGP